VGNCRSRLSPAIIATQRLLLQGFVYYSSGLGITPNTLFHHR
jgi:hypothetical protein